MVSPETLQRLASWRLVMYSDALGPLPSIGVAICAFTPNPLHQPMKPKVKPNVSDGAGEEQDPILNNQREIAEFLEISRSKLQRLRRDGKLVRWFGNRQSLSRG